MSATDIAVDMDGISKSFAGTPVLIDCQLRVHKGEIHALMGANGAGKSTMMKILTGVHHKDAGTTRISQGDGDLVEVTFPDPRSARDAGIAIVHQELILVEGMSVADNIELGREATLARGTLVDRRARDLFARDALARIDADVDPRSPVDALSPAEKQLVEIARALAFEARVLILDEPTTSLSDAEARKLHDVLRSLAAAGLAIIYISHRMDEVFALSDAITVFRDGRNVASMRTATATRQGLIHAMIGRELGGYGSSTPAAKAGPAEVSSHVRDEPVLRVRGLVNRRLKGVSLDVHAGEIVGLFGLVGAGRTELVRAAYGIDDYDLGTVVLHGVTLPKNRPHAVAEAGVALVPEDRKTAGLVLDLPIIRNLELAALRSMNVLVDGQRHDAQLWDRFRDALGIVARDRQQTTRTLSGGNQQKIVLAKWLATSPDVLILDEPTRGIDVGAKHDIYELIRGLASQGKAILFISSESEEIQLLAHRVVVMREGRITHDGPNTGLDDEALLRYAMGESK